MVWEGQAWEYSRTLAVWEFYFIGCPLCPSTEEISWLCPRPPNASTHPVSQRPTDKWKFQSSETNYPPEQLLNTLPWHGCSVSCCKWRAFFSSLSTEKSLEFSFHLHACVCRSSFSHYPSLSLYLYISLC